MGCFFGSDDNGLDLRVLGDLGALRRPSVEGEALSQLLRAVTLEVADHEAPGFGQGAQGARVFLTKVPRSY
jgi:hypothetical protein